MWCNVSYTLGEVGKSVKLFFNIRGSRNRRRRGRGQLLNLSKKRFKEAEAQRLLLNREGAKGVFVGRISCLIRHRHNAAHTLPSLPNQNCSCANNFFSMEITGPDCIAYRILKVLPFKAPLENLWVKYEAISRFLNRLKQCNILF